MNDMWLLYKPYIELDTIYAVSTNYIETILETKDTKIVYNLMSESDISAYTIYRDKIIPIKKIKYERYKLNIYSNFILFDNIIALFPIDKVIKIISVKTSQEDTTISIDGKVIIIQTPEHFLT